MSKIGYKTESERQECKEIAHKMLEAKYDELKAENEKQAERIKELEGVMLIIQKDSSAGLATMKNEERPDIQYLLRRLSSLVAGCQIESKP